MLIAASFLLGVFTDLWPVPILAGLVGEVAHLASSRHYRCQLQEVPGVKTAAVLSVLTLSAICICMFWIGYGVRQLFA